MSEISPLNRLPYPRNLEESYFETMKSFFLSNDSAHWATSENGNLVFSGGGTFIWSANTAQLSWSAPVYITGFTSATLAKAVISAGSLTIFDGQVVYFTMPRSITANTPVALEKGTKIAQTGGTRMHDQRLFCARIGSNLYFPDGKILEDGQSAALFLSSGSGTLIAPHIHQPALIIEPGAIGVSTLNLQLSSINQTRLIYVSKVGEFTVTETVSGNVSLSTGVVSEVGTIYVLLGSFTGSGFQVGETITGNFNLVNITVNTVTGFNLNDGVTAGGAVGVIRKITGLVLTVRVISGVFPGSGTITDTTTSATATISSTSAVYNATAQLVDIVPPTSLRKVDIYRNGQLLAEGASRDYTVDYSTGIVTLIVPTLTTTERFIAQRESTPGTGVTNVHSHSKLLVSISSPTSTLSTLNTALDPSPNKLQQINLYKNGFLLAEPADYTLDLSTGVITLVTTAISGETFIIDRELA